MDNKTLVPEEPVFVPNEEYIQLLIERAEYLKVKHTRYVNNKIVNGYARIKEIEKGLTGPEIIKNTKLAFKK